MLNSLFFIVGKFRSILLESENLKVLQRLFCPGNAGENLLDLIQVRC